MLSDLALEVKARWVVMLRAAGRTPKAATFLATPNASDANIAVLELLNFISTTTDLSYRYT